MAKKNFGTWESVRNDANEEIRTGETARTRTYAWTKRDMQEDGGTRRNIGTEWITPGHRLHTSSTTKRKVGGEIYKCVPFSVAPHCV